MTAQYPSSRAQRSVLNGALQTRDLGGLRKVRKKIPRLRSVNKNCRSARGMTGTMVRAFKNCACAISPAGMTRRGVQL